MTAAPTQIVGFSSTDKVPGFVGEVVYGAGVVSASSIPLVCLLVGTKTSAGSATANQDIVRIYSADDADTYLGAGSELACMCYDAIAAAPSAQIWAAPLAEAGGAAAGTAVFTVTGTWTTTGTLKIRVDGIPYQCQITSTDTPTTAAATIASTISSDARGSCTAASALGVATATRKSKGARGNQGSIWVDSTLLPAGCVVTPTGGAALAGPGGGARFSSGSGAEDPATLITALFPGQYDRIGLATNDATYLASWKTTVASKSGPLEMRPSHITVCLNGTVSAAATIATTTLNDQRFQLLHQLNGEMPPSRIAAAFAAMRSVAESNDPDSAYDGKAIPTAAPQANRADWPQRSTLVAQLNNGVTPLSTTPDGKVVVIRSITTRSLNGSNPDYTTLDTSDAYVPDFVRRDLGLYWNSFFLPANPRVADDPATTSRDRPQGVGTPKLWNASVTGKLREYEQGLNGAPPMIVDVDTHLPTSGYDSVAKRIMSVVPVVAAPNQHQIGVSVRQENS